MEQKSSKNQFNTSAEKDIENKLNGYKLTDQEKSNIWNIVGNRDQLIKDQQTFYDQNKESLIDQEYNRLRGAQSPKNNLNYGPAQPRNAILRGQAIFNVDNANINAKNEIARNADISISGILANARKEGRGPDNDLTSEFQRAHDNNRPR